KDYRDTFTNFHAKKFNTPDSRCTRLHFFDAQIDAATIREATKIQNSYLGYAVIRPTRPNCLGRTLLNPSGCGLQDAHIRLCSERVTIQGTELSTSGFPFISQDGDVTVCAQSALWMLVRYFSNRYSLYPETYPYGLTSLVQDYSIGRIVPSGGLAVWQMAEAARQIGFAPLIYGRDRYPDFDHLMYTYVESGIPVLAAFDGHVAILFGHRSDFSAAAGAIPAAGSSFVFSSQFNRAFIGNDDNGWPYQVLENVAKPDGMIFPDQSVKPSYTISDVKQFIAPLPERVYLSADKFQVLVTALLGHAKYGYKVLSPQLSKVQPCLRLFLTSGRSYKKRLVTRGMGSPDVLEMYLNLPLPHFIWVCELSDVKLYPNRVLGEIIWDATRNEHEPNGWIALHYPEVLIVDAGSALNQGPRLLESAVASATDYPIYESNLERV
ncbi:MAG: hypothetical protein ACREJC_05110, partial [Tepidisphaeraceae bacterium]